jgi:hypothetical protein
MKLIKSILIAGLMMISVSIANAQPPAPNGGNTPNSGNTPVGGGAPIDGGASILIILGLAYGARRAIELKNGLQ